MNRQNINEKCHKPNCDGTYRTKSVHLWDKRNNGLVYCDECGDVADEYEYSKMYDSIIKKTGSTIENNITYFEVWYETREIGNRIANYINIEKAEYFENKRNIKLHNLENLIDICLKNKYVKVYHKAIHTEFGTDGFGLHGINNPLINEWIYYFKDCRLHNEYGPAILMNEKDFLAKYPDSPLAENLNENGTSKLYGCFYIDGIEIGFRASPTDKNCVSNDEEFLKCMKIKKLSRNKNSSGTYEPEPELSMRCGYCNELWKAPDGYHWIKELKDHKSDYTLEIINEHEKIYKGKGTIIHTVDDKIESINDKPAVEFCCGQIKYWFKNNQLHREYGPAIITTEFEKYFINNEEISTDEEKINFNRSKILAEILNEKQEL